MFGVPWIMAENPEFYWYAFWFAKPKRSETAKWNVQNRFPESQSETEMKQELGEASVYQRASHLNDLG